MTWLITGAAGYLGQHVMLAAQQAQIDAVGMIHRQYAPHGTTVQCDLTDHAALNAMLDHVQPQVIIHTAAVTPVVGAAMTSELLWQVNVLASATLARWTAQHHARLVHVSSDAIWGGRDEPYTEHDVPAPINPYGASKAAAEAVVTTHNPQAVIARTSLLYGFDPPDPNTIMAQDMANGRRAGVLFTDERRCPIAVGDVAQALLELGQRTELHGIFHVVGPTAVSRYELGCALVAWHGGDPATIPAGSAAASGLRRPSQVVVSNQQTQAVLHTRLRSVAEVTRS